MALCLNNRQMIMPVNRVNTIMQSPPTTPFSARLLDISAISLCLLVLWLPSRFDVMSMQWLHRFLNERGLAQQLALYIIIRNLIAVGIARTRRELPDCYTRQLLAFSVLPLLLGIAGFIRVSTYAAGGFGNYLAHSPDPTTQGAFSGLLLVMGMSMDNMLLGLIGTVASFFFYVQSLTTKKMIVQQGVPGYRRQSAPQPEP